MLCMTWQRKQIQDPSMGLPVRNLQYARGRRRKFGHDPQYRTPSMIPPVRAPPPPQYLVPSIRNPKRTMYLTIPKGDDASVYDSQAVWKIWVASPKTPSLSLNPCYRGSLQRHHRLRDLSPNLVLAKPENPNVNILVRRMPDLVLIPKQSRPKEKKCKKSSKSKKHKHSSRSRSRDDSRLSRSDDHKCKKPKLSCRSRHRQGKQVKAATTGASCVSMATVRDF